MQPQLAVIFAFSLRVLVGVAVVNFGLNTSGSAASDGGADSPSESGL